jgi:glutathione S-transferase
VLELYYFHGATCGLKARLTLAEKGVDYTHRAVERAYLASAEYRRLNPNGVVPTLVHDGQVLIESSIIMHYVDDAFDGPALVPDAPMARARMRHWLKRADEEYLPAVGTLSYTVSFREPMMGKSADAIEAYLATIPDAPRRERRRAALTQGLDAPGFAAAIATLDDMLATMEATLADQDWLAGPAYSLADAALTPFLERLDELACQGMWQHTRPQLSAWYDRIRTRPSYQTVLTANPNPERPQHTRTGQAAWPHIAEILSQ